MSVIVADYQRLPNWVTPMTQEERDDYDDFLDELPDRWGINDYFSELHHKAGSIKNFSARLITNFNLYRYLQDDKRRSQALDDFGRGIQRLFENNECMIGSLKDWNFTEVSQTRHGNVTYFGFMTNNYKFIIADETDDPRNRMTMRCGARLGIDDGEHVWQIV